jgi:hypothetical protein
MIHKRWPDASGTNTEFMMAGSIARLLSELHRAQSTPWLTWICAGFYLHAAKLNQIKQIP